MTEFSLAEHAHAERSEMHRKINGANKLAYASAALSPCNMPVGGCPLTTCHLMLEKHRRISVFFVLFFNTDWQFRACIVNWHAAQQLSITHRKGLCQFSYDAAEHLRQ